MNNLQIMTCLGMVLGLYNLGLMLLRLPESKREILPQITALMWNFVFLLNIW